MSIGTGSTLHRAGLDCCHYQHNLLQAAHELIDAFVVSPRLCDQFTETLHCEGDAGVRIQLSSEMKIFRVC